MIILKPFKFIKRLIDKKLDELYENFDFYGEEDSHGNAFENTDVFGLPSHEYNEHEIKSLFLGVPLGGDPKDFGIDI